MANQAYAFKTGYTTRLNSVAIDDYKEFFASIGVPSPSKLGVVFDIVHSYPMLNGNFHGFSADVLRNSYKTFINSPIDINHERGSICGTIVDAQLVENGNAPLTVRLVAVLYRDILKEWGIEDLMNEDWSMECLFSNVLYVVGGKVYKPEDVPEIDAQFNDLADGKPVFDNLGNRVGMLLGGSDAVDFNGCGLIIWGSGADPLAETHLQVANNKNQEGVNTELNYTEEQMNEAKAELQKQIDKLTADLESAQASLKEKDEALKNAEASLVAEKERADKAEAELKNQATAKLVDERKQVLASKNYDVEEDDMSFLAEASQEDFDKFVKRIEKVQASTVKTLQAKAQEMGSQAFASLNLTGEGEQNSGTQTNEEHFNPLL